MQYKQIFTSFDEDLEGSLGASYIIEEEIFCKKRLVNICMRLFKIFEIMGHADQQYHGAYRQQISFFTFISHHPPCISSKPFDHYSLWPNYIRFRDFREPSHYQDKFFSAKYLYIYVHNVELKLEKQLCGGI